MKQRNGEEQKDEKQPVDGHPRKKGTATPGTTPALPMAAFVAGRFPSLTEQPVLSQATGLLDRGWDVKVIARRAQDGSGALADFLDYGMEGRTTYRRMPSNAFVRCAYALPIIGQLAVHSPGLLLNALNFMRFGTAAASLRLTFEAAQAQRAVSGGRVDVVHAHFGPNGILAERMMRLGALPPGAALVVSFYGYDVGRYPHDHGRDVYARMFERSDRVLVLSEHMAERLRKLGCPDRKVVVHHVGVDPSRFLFAERTAPADGVVRLVSVARSVEKKGIEVALRALAMMSRERGGAEWSYTLVGDGPLRGTYERMIGELGLAGRVKLTGRMAQKEVAEILAESHVLLAPSVTAANGDEEGTPVALMEAMSMGLPVISTFHAGIPEVVRDGECGMLVPERDEVALAAAIGRVISKPVDWVRLGKAGRRRVEEEFSVDRLNDRLIGHYREAIDERRASLGRTH